MRALTAVASAKAGVRVQQPLQICLECRSKSKKCDKQLTHIVRVMCQPLFYDHIGERMNIMAKGKETAIAIMFKTIPSQTGTSRILFNAIVAITIAQISIIK